MQRERLLGDGAVFGICRARDGEQIVIRLLRSLVEFLPAAGLGVVEMLAFETGLDIQVAIGRGVEIAQGDGRRGMVRRAPDARRRPERARDERDENEAQAQGSDPTHETSMKLHLGATSDGEMMVGSLFTIDSFGVVA